MIVGSNKFVFTHIGFAIPEEFVAQFVARLIPTPFAWFIYKINYFVV